LIKSISILPNLYAMTQVDRIVVITQFERLLSSHLPIDIVDKIMRHSLEDCPSVGTLLMYYKNTPAIVALHPLPLADNPDYINTVSKSLLVQLKQKPVGGHLASYHRLMRVVFSSHFDMLTFPEQLKLSSAKSPLWPMDAWNLSTGPTLPSDMETSPPLRVQNWWSTDLPTVDPNDTDTESSQKLQ
jgi:hypothetical protein